MIQSITILVLALWNLHTQLKINKLEKVANNTLDALEKSAEMHQHNAQGLTDLANRVVELAKLFR